MRYVNLSTPVPLPCSALTEAWKISCGAHSCLVVWGVYIAKIRFRIGGKILFRSVLRRGQRVRTGFVLRLCALVLLCVMKEQRCILCCTTKPALSIWIYFVSKKFHNRVVFYRVGHKSLTTLCKSQSMRRSAMFVIWNDGSWQRVMTFHLTFLSGLWTIWWIDCTDAWHRRGPTLSTLCNGKHGTCKCL
jgi:hypothetical protein